MTRTYVRYFGEDQTARLRGALDDLEADWRRRRVHVSSDVCNDGDARLSMARLAVKFLSDRVPE